MKADTIVIFDQATPEASIGRPTQARGTESRLVRAVELSSNTLETALTGFIEALSGMLDNVQSKSGDYAVDTVEVSAQVGADGRVGIMGIGASAQATSSLKIIFKRKG